MATNYYIVDACKWAVVECHFYSDKKRQIAIFESLDEARVYKKEVERMYKESLDKNALGFLIAYAVERVGE